MRFLFIWLCLVTPPAFSQDPTSAPPAGIPMLPLKPEVQNALRALMEPEIRNKIQILIDHPAKKKALYYGIFWAVFMIAFRAWGFARLGTRQWVKRLGWEFGTLILFVAGASIVIPSLTFGDTYFEVIREVGKILGVLKQ